MEAATCAVLRRNRRKVEAFSNLMYMPSGESPPELLLAYSAPDYPGVMMQFYAGRSQSTRFLSKFARDLMVYPATSQFAPEPEIVALAVNKGRYLQRMRTLDDGGEIYAGTPAFLLSAGGTEGPNATPAFIESGVEVPEILQALVPEYEDANGAGAPTVLIPHGPSGMRVSDFIRFEGTPRQIKNGGTIYKNNLCVWTDFACGRNLVIPSRIVPCLKRRSTATGPNGWYFLDSAAGCVDTRPDVRFFVAFYLTNITVRHGELVAGMAVMEPVSVLSTEDFSRFIDTTVGRNPGYSENTSNLGGVVTNLAGVYRTRSGDDIKYAVKANESDRRHIGIESVNGARVPLIGAWPHATGIGSVMQGEWAASQIDVRLPGTGRVLTFDLRDWRNPQKTVTRP